MDAFPTELDAEGVLAASVSTVRERRAAQVKDWLLVLQWLRHPIARDPAFHRVLRRLPAFGRN